MELPNTDIAVRGLMYPMVLPAAEGEELLGDPAALHDLKDEVGDDAVKAVHAFLLNSADEHQESVLLMVLLSSSGSVNGVAGLRDAETELKASVVKCLPHLELPILSVCDGDPANRPRPQAVAVCAVEQVKAAGLNSFMHEGLHEFAARQDPEIRSSPDRLHVTKLEVNRAMPDGSRLAMFPLLPPITSCRSARYRWSWVRLARSSTPGGS
jgi:hypothetical protein